MRLTACIRTCLCVVGLVLAPVITHAMSFTVNSTVDAVDLRPGDGLCATAAGTCTLRAALQEANSLAGSDTIVLRAGVYSLTLIGSREDAAATGDLDITSNVTISGNGAVIDGNGAVLFDRVVHITTSVTVAISGVVIRGGHTDFEGVVFSSPMVRWSR